MAIRLSTVFKILLIILTYYLISTLAFALMFFMAHKTEIPTDADHMVNASANTVLRRPAVQWNLSKSDTLVSHENIAGTENRKYNLTQILVVRIYENDKAQWTIKELKQWLHYIYFAGVEHVYLCDHFVYLDERLDGRLNTYITQGLLTYIPWPWNAIDNHEHILEHQQRCYDYVNKTYGHASTWQMSIDMDEFPFCPGDVKRGFLVRYLARACDRCQILMQNYLMMGQGDRRMNTTIDRINRIVNSPINRLTKPIYRPAHVLALGIHSHKLISGYKDVTGGHKNTSNGVIMLHYWGARTQNWGPDTNETLQMTTEFNVVRNEIAPQV